jgi:hypothetical protein
MEGYESTIVSNCQQSGTNTNANMAKGSPMYFNLSRAWILEILRLLEERQVDDNQDRICMRGLFRKSLYTKRRLVF